MQHLQYSAWISSDALTMSPAPTACDHAPRPQTAKEATAVPQLRRVKSVDFISPKQGSVMPITPTEADVIEAYLAKSS